MVSGAIRTDFILSAEIMVIALNEVADQGFVPRLVILVIVALVITVAVYGVVAGIVKMDDVGLHLTKTGSRIGQNGRAGSGRGDAQTADTALGGRDGGDALGGRPHSPGGRRPTGLARPYGVVHHAEDGVRRLVESVGGVLAWLVNTGISAVIGSVVGAVVLVLMLPVRLLRRAGSSRS